MPTISATLQQQEGDARSNQIAYSLVLQNNDSHPLAITAIVPLIPDDAQLVRVRDAIGNETQAAYRHLCGQLTELAMRILLESDPVFKESMTQVLAKVMRQVMRTHLGFMGLAMASIESLTHQLRNSAERAAEAAGLFRYNISTLAHADAAFTSFVAPSSAPAFLKELFQRKRDQLAELTEELKAQGKPPNVITLGPGDEYKQTYVIKVRRSVAEPKRLSFSVDCRYAPSTTADPQLITASTTLCISPSPVVLTIIAILASLLGVAMKVALVHFQGSRSTPPDGQLDYAVFTAVGGAFVGAPRDCSYCAGCCDVQYLRVDRSGQTNTNDGRLA